MQKAPETRESLILRLPKHSDAVAWKEFIEIYEPLLFRFARRRGLQDADAREIAQNVFVSVAVAVDRWSPNPERGPFRAWLFKIARNQLINYVAKHHRIRASGNTETWDALNANSSEESYFADLERDYKREMFRLAASQIRETVHETTWRAFWNTAVLGKTANDTANELGVSTGAVYVAKCRVTAQIREVVKAWEDSDAI